jgi:DNA-binding NarL/FixJ family response regulator
MPPLPRTRFTLTPRQEQIMDLVVDEGLSHKQIARRLVISIATVKNHFYGDGHTRGRKSINQRMECSNMTEAAVAYLGYRSLKAREMLNGHTREEGTGR